ncbi:uncharacterized protein ATC70_009370 [Mucor velutinosus]|uniref:CAP-Gly domain-containing protein n=1 Tax=Mucor velutinosus TaxID=708070 RepID=A0AAN7DL60_9FUNG|nr:hypothetical protein ATC70_009370 [Mucor velutinosus]
MFERPTKTLKHSLFNVFENAQDYVADVCFDYPNQKQKIWAHKALLIARVPEAFRTKYMAPLEQQQQQAAEHEETTTTTTTTTTKQATITLDISVVIPYTTLRQLLRFWYIAQFSAPLDDASLLSSHVAGLDLEDASSSLQSEVELNIRREITALEERLEVKLIPVPSTVGPHADTHQWTSDLKRMMDEKICCDVVVNIFNVPHGQPITNQVSFPAHRFILASQSPYFYSVFCTEFREASTSSVHMPSDLFSSTALQVILHYFYTDMLILPPFVSAGTKKSQPHIARLNEKKHELRILQKVFGAADFLGHYDTICKAVLVKMSVICHHFKCVCTECAVLLPSMLLFADKNEKYVSKLRHKLLSLYADPLDSLAPLWSQKPFAILVNSLNSAQAATTAPVIPSTTTASTLNSTTNKADSGAEVISQIFSNKASAVPPPAATTTSNATASATPQQANSLDGTQSLSSSSTTTTIPTANELGLVAELTERTFANITKHNSVRALHSLHLCLSYLRGADPFPTWSQPVLTILNQFLHYTVDMISSNFDYYCVEYPILLSCVDGIGFGFSVDFLGFVLTRVLTEGIHDGNAAILYQGIVRDLGGRQEMVRNVAVDSVLLDARVKCASYLSRRWMAVKAEGGFVNIDKEILRLIAEDINVPTKALTKPLENDFSTMFSFKPKKASNTTVSRAVSKEDALATSTIPSSNASKRLSFGSATASIHPQDNDTQLPSGQRLGRSRSLSASNNTQESILKKDSQLRNHGHHSDNEDIVMSVGSIRRSSNSNSSIHYRSYRRQGSTGSLTDALLPIDTISKDATAADTSKDGKTEAAPRPTRLRFALPDTPSRVKPNSHRLSAIQGSQQHSGNMNHAQKAAARKGRRAKSPGKSRWSLGYSTSDSSDDESGGKYKHIPLVGQKVELLRRPLPTQGTIKYIGEVEFAKGTWVGVELESRLGNNDGSVDGKRYFETFPQRGVFVKIDDFKIIAPPAEKK